MFACIGGGALIMAGALSSGLTISAQSDATTLEERVLELLVGKEGALYFEGRPDWWELLRIGEASLPIILKHARDDKGTYRAAWITLHEFASRRVVLPDYVRQWVREELKRDTVGAEVAAIAGELGLADQIPRLEQIAKSYDRIGSCVVAQSLAAIGTDDARKALERMQNANPPSEASRQAKVLLEQLFYPYGGYGGDVALLHSIETSGAFELRYAYGGDIAPYERLTRRLVHGGRKDLVPKLREIVARIGAKDEEDQKREGNRLVCILRAIKLLGGDLNQAENRMLEDARIIEVPRQDKP